MSIDHIQNISPLSQYKKNSKRAFMVLMAKYVVETVITIR